MTARNRGFTLIEILVVIVLLGLLTSVAVFTLGSGKLQRELENESKRLHALLRMASEEAILSNTEIGLVIDDESYEFLEYDEEKQRWSGSGVAVLKKREFPEWLAIAFQREGRAIDILGKDGDEYIKPDMMLLSSGEVTPFSIVLQIKNSREGLYTIKSDGLEAIQLQTPADEEE